jgi:hypothetical protein
VSLSESGMSRIVRGLGFAKLSARPRHHAQNEYAIEDFKKTWPCLKMVLFLFCSDI